MVCNKYVIKSDIKFLFWHFDALDFKKTALQLSHLVRCNSLHYYQTQTFFLSCKITAHWMLRFWIIHEYAFTDTIVQFDKISALYPALGPLRLITINIITIQTFKLSKPLDITVSWANIFTILDLMKEGRMYVEKTNFGTNQFHSFL